MSILEYRQTVAIKQYQLKQAEKHFNKAVSNFLVEPSESNKELLNLKANSYQTLTDEFLTFLK